MKLGHPLKHVAERASLLAQCPRSTAQVEQPHVVPKVSMKAHPSYSPSTFLARSMITQSRRLFIVDEDANRAQRLKGRVHKLQGKQPHNITGMHLYCRALQLRRALYKHRKHEYGSRCRKKLFDNHQRLYDAEPQENKLALAEMAIGLQEELQEATRKKVKCLMQQAKASQERFRHRNERGGTSIRMGRCRLSEHVKVVFDDLRLLSEWDMKKARASRASSVMEIGQPLAFETQLLESMSIFAPAPLPPPSALVSWIAQYRDYMQSAIFRVQRAESTMHFKFSCASRNPLLVCGCQVHR